MKRHRAELLINTFLGTENVTGLLQLASGGWSWVDKSGATIRIAGDDLLLDLWEITGHQPESLMVLHRMVHDIQLLEFTERHIEDGSIRPKRIFIAEGTVTGGVDYIGEFVEYKHKIGGIK